jgi:flagellar hook-associated protein 3 FlgL
MRITEYGTTLFHIRQLETNRSRQDRLHLQISSGRRLIKDSDNPSNAAEASAVRRQAGYLALYKENIERARSTMSYADSTLSNATQLLYQAQQLAHQAASSLLPSTQLKKSAEAIRNIRKELVDMANSSLQGVYVFGGAQNTTKPYIFIDPDDPTNPNPDPLTSYVAFRGDNNDRDIQVAAQLDIQDTLSGSKIFSTDIYPTNPIPNPPPAPSNPEDVFETLRLLAQAVEQGNIKSGTPNFTDLAPVLEKARARISDSRGILGARLNLIQQVETDLQDQELQLTARKSSLEDTDIAKDVSELTLAQTANQATLYAQGSVMKSTLFDFIG